MDKNNKPQSMPKFIKDIAPLCLGECAVVLLIILAALALQIGGLISFDGRIVSGAILGAVVTIINYMILIISVDREVEKFLKLRGDREMTDEEAEKFANENSAPIQNAFKRSSLTRTISLVGALLIAFITKLFNPLATVIPLLAYRPLLTIIETIKSKCAPAPNPEKYIKYDYDENTEKESD